MAKFADICRSEPFKLTQEEGNQVAKLRELLQPPGCDSKGRPHPQCSYNLHIGVFFDGTNNNKYFDTKGDSHSNVARLYDVFPGKGATTSSSSSTYFDSSSRDKKEHKNIITKSASSDEGPKWFKNMDSMNKPHMRKIYIPGVGTPFPEVGDYNNSNSENQDGEAFAKYGDHRILWGIWQILNLIMEDLGHSPAEATKVRGNIRANTKQQAEFAVRNTFRSHLEEFLPKLKNDKKPTLLRVKLYVFGFSRGAIEARCFCTRVQNFLSPDYLKKRGVTFGIDIVFLGIFDSVASVGIARSSGMTIGHFDWASLSLVNPAVRCVHLVAAHEVRGSFPLTVMKGNTEEIVYPGVHSDIGGGYEPREQGKSLNGDGSKLSQIPLADMYRKALLAGVPFLLPEEWGTRSRGYMKVNKDIISAFNDYAKVAGASEKSETKSLIYKHYTFYVWWRRMRYENGGVYQALSKAISQARTAKRDADDIIDSDKGLKIEIDMLLKGKYNPIFRESIDKEELKIILSISTINNYAKLSDWNNGVKSMWNSYQQLKKFPAATFLFDNYVHDSRAWFRIEPPEAWGYLRLRGILNT